MRLAAIALVVGLAAHEPLSARITTSMGQGEREAEQVHAAAAFTAYSRVVERVGLSPMLYRQLIALSLDTAHFAEARVYLYKLAELEGWSDARRQDLVQALDQTGDVPEGFAISLSLAGSEVADPAVLAAAADAALSRQAWDEAQVALERLVVADANDGRALFQLGALIAPVDPDRAVLLLQDALAFPTWALPAQTVLDTLYAFDALPLTEARTGVGLALVWLGNWPLAEHALVQAVAVNSVNFTALGYLGFVRDQQGRDGLTDLESALAMAPADPTLYYLLGLHWQNAGNEPAAYDALLQAHALDPGNPALIAEIGASLQRQGDLASAEAWYQQAMAVSPDDATWKGLLAAFYADSEIELNDDRVQFVKDVAALMPFEPDTTTSLGWVYYRIGEYDNAYEALSTAIQLDPSLARTRYYFGAVLEHLGDRDGAADSFRYVVDQVGSDSGFGLLASRGLARLGYTY